MQYSASGKFTLPVLNLAISHGMQYQKFLGFFADTRQLRIAEVEFPLRCALASSLNCLAYSDTSLPCLIQRACISSAAR